MNKLDQKKRDLVFKILLIIAVAAVIGVEVWYRSKGSRSDFETDLYNSLSRLAGAMVALIFMIEFSLGTVLSPFGNKRVSSLIFIIPALVIAINNFPWVSFFAGDCTMTASVEDFLFYAFICLCVGLFEEIAFRGCVLMYLMRKRTHNKLAVFMAIFWSSVVFGAVHLVNIFTSSPAAVFLQIGYSALIGGLCSLVLLETKNIWACVLTHALYNFAGGVVPRFGGGMIWSSSEVIFTAVVSVIVVVFCVWRFIVMPIDNAKNLFGKQEKYGNL